MTGRLDLEAAEFIQDALTREGEMREEYVQGLRQEELRWRPGPEANHIGWILWHMARVEDFWVQFFIQRKLETWERDGWHEKFGLPTRNNGFGHTPQQVRDFPDLDLGEIMSYWRAVRPGTLEYVAALTPDQLELVPRERRPEMSVKAILHQIIGEFYQHLGHIDYIKGLMGSRAALSQADA